MPYKHQSFYVDVKLEEPATIEDMVDDIVQRLELSTKGNCVKTKRSVCLGKSSFVDYLIEEKLGYVSSGSGDNFLRPYRVRQPSRRTLLYVSGDILPSDYYRIEGYPSYEAVRILADNLRKEGIQEAQKELKPEAPAKSPKQGKDTEVKKKKKR